ncbi:MAG: phosphoketolase, partial [Rhodanobacter sp.]
GGADPDVVMACCGDVPTIETMAAVDILRRHLPQLRVRVVNVVNLMKLQSPSEHPHGLDDTEFDTLFTKDKPVIFAYHGYPSLIHQLTYRRTNHSNLHVHGYQEEGTTTTPFDMTVRNKLDRFHLVMAAVTRVSGFRAEVDRLHQQMQERLAAHHAYINEHGDDMPEIRNWRWSTASSVGMTAAEKSNNDQR